MYQTIDFYKVSARVGKQKPFQDPKTERVDCDKPLKYTISLLTPDCMMFWILCTQMRYPTADYRCSQIDTQIFGELIEMSYS